MRLDPSLNPQVNTTDASGSPKLPRSPLAYARTAPAFTRAMASASQSGALAPEGNVATWNTAVRSGQTLTGIVREQMASRMTTEDEDLVDRIAASVTRMNSLINDLPALDSADDHEDQDHGPGQVAKAADASRETEGFEFGELWKVIANAGAGRGIGRLGVGECGRLAGRRMLNVGQAQLNRRFGFNPGIDPGFGQRLQVGLRLLL